MTPVTFTGYGVLAEDPTIIAERITHWYRVEYNGRSGTRIVLDTGIEITVAESAHEVEQKVKASLARFRAANGE